MSRLLAFLTTVLLTSGCASTYELTLMPRNSGKLYHGVAEHAGAGEGTISVLIENRTYTGTWVEIVADRTQGFVSGGFGTRRHGIGLGSVISLDNPAGGQSNALLRSPDGAGLRCEFRGGGGFAGGGVCRDDKGLEYDVQIRPARDQRRAPQS